MSDSFSPKQKQAAYWLALIAYTDPDDTSSQKKCIRINLSNEIDGSSNGPYELVWGPANQGGTLTYVAKGADGSYAVACRGTISLDVDDAWNFLLNAYDDLDSLFSSKWQYPPVDNNDGYAWITSGMSDALNAVVTATDPDTGSTLIGFLTNALGKTGNKNLPLMVAGHSLGAGLANLVAPYLAYSLPLQISQRVPVIPFTFAAPTVSNDIFASQVFAKYCPASFQCVNTNDIVPMAWTDLSKIQNAYNVNGDYFPPLFHYSTLLWLATGAISLWISHLGYDFTPVKPADSNPDIFTAKLVPGAVWGTQASDQHSLQGPYHRHIFHGKSFSSRPKVPGLKLPGGTGRDGPYPPGHGPKPPAQLVLGAKTSGSGPDSDSKKVVLSVRPL